MAAPSGRLLGRGLFLACRWPLRRVLPWLLPFALVRREHERPPSLPVLTRAPFLWDRDAVLTASVNPVTSLEACLQIPVTLEGHGFNIRNIGDHILSTEFAFV